MKKLLTLLLMLLCAQVSAQDTTLANSIDTTKRSLEKSILEQTEKASEVKTAEAEYLTKKRLIDSLNKMQTTTKEHLNLLKKEIDALYKAGKKLEEKNKDLSQLVKDNETKVKQLDTLLQKRKDAVDLESKKADSLKKRADTLYEKTKMLKKDTDTLIAEQKKTQITLDSQRAAIAKQEDSLEVIARITMGDSLTVRRIVYKKVKSNKYKDSIIVSDVEKAFCTRIRNVHITIKEGIVMEISVETDSGTFRNQKSIIDLTHFGDRGHDKLFYVNQKFRWDGRRLFVFLDDAIIYDPIQSYSDLPYIDCRITLSNTEKDKTYLIRESTSINSYFNIAAFTDIKGISGEPNGIAQFTADAKFITNTKNFKNGAIVLLNYLSFRGGLSKFDNSFKGSEIINEDSVSRKDLLQRSHYFVGAKLNLIRFFRSPYPKHLIEDMQLNAGYNFMGSRVFDTLYKDVARTVIDTAYRTVTMNQFYIEPVLTFNRHKNFSMSLSLPVYMNSVKESAGLKNQKLEYWAVPGISLMYYSKRDTNNKLFFRYNHFINLKNKSQAFSQMQLGYSVNLTDVWGN